MVTSHSSWLVWWIRRFHKIRRRSHILAAAPSCVTFLRKTHKRATFRYDPLSYALNFDDGVPRRHDHDHHLYLHFSAHFASITASSVDGSTVAR
ncbi:hypothetical protein K1719_007472 [Acacia pycnantha]|nr:hypothetical protein K1719_007472 [Acacia pycnantha]